MKKNTKKFTKLAAVFTALMLALTCFVGCSNGSDDVEDQKVEIPGGSEDGGKNTPGEDDPDKN